MHLGPRSRITRAVGAASAVQAGRTIVLDPARGTYHGFDELGSRVWALLDGAPTADDVATRVAREYDAPSERVERDVKAFLARLIEGDLARVDDEPRAPRVATCGVALAAARAALLALGFERTLALARHAALGRPRRAAPRGFLDRAARSVAIAGALFPGRARCLEQSLALYVILRRAGVEARLNIGAQPFLFSGHAWVEHEGAPVNDSPERLNGTLLLVSVVD
jgi:hypothetical protein